MNLSAMHAFFTPSETTSAHHLSFPKLYAITLCPVESNKGRRYACQCLSINKMSEFIEVKGKFDVK